jgi:hypothetical protein
LHTALSNGSSIRKQYLADDAEATACVVSQISRALEREPVLVAISSMKKIANLVTRESKCRRIAIRL